MSDSPTPTPSPIFEMSTMSMNELRQPRDLTQRLQSQPFEGVELTRYDDRVGVVVSPQLWSFLLEAVEGRARAFQVPMQSSETGMDTAGPCKRVIAHEHAVSAAPLQRWEVLVDGMRYELMSMVPRSDEPKPDYTQLLWKHHPDVARQVLERFEWTDEHGQELTRHQRCELDDDRHAWARGRELARALRLHGQGHGVEIHDSWDEEPVSPMYVESVNQLA